MTIVQRMHKLFRHWENKSHCLLYLYMQSRWLASTSRSNSEDDHNTASTSISWIIQTVGLNPSQRMFELTITDPSLLMHGGLKSWTGPVWLDSIKPPLEFRSNNTGVPVISMNPHIPTDNQWSTKRCKCVNSKATQHLCCAAKSDKIKLCITYNLQPTFSPQHFQAKSCQCSYTHHFLELAVCSDGVFSGDCFGYWLPDIKHRIFSLWLNNSRCTDTRLALVSVSKCDTSQAPLDTITTHVPPTVSKFAVSRLTPRCSKPLFWSNFNRFIVSSWSSCSFSFLSSHFKLSEVSELTPLVLSPRGIFSATHLHSLYIVLALGRQVYPCRNLPQEVLSPVSS